MGENCFTRFCFCHTAMLISHNYTYITYLLSLSPLPSSHPSRSSQTARLGFQCCIATSHQLSILHICCPVAQLCPTLQLHEWQTLQASLSFTVSQSLLRLMSIELVMHPIISSSVAPFSSALRFSQQRGPFPESALHMGVYIAGSVPLTAGLWFSCFWHLLPGR